jgi:bifunctional NMN adenylyltransferase/nudix hydrolase
MKVGVVIGRFQISELHEGHRKLLEAVIKDNDMLLVLLGCPSLGVSSHDPIDYLPRHQMITTLCENVIIAPIFDTVSDTAWSSTVDSLIFGFFPGVTRENITLYGGRDSFISLYTGRNKTRALDFGDSDPCASDIRDKITAMPVPTPDFRKGMIYALSNCLPRVIPTVDIIMWKDKTPEAKPAPLQILLIKKKHEKLWRVPGGFVDLTDESFELAASRELHEETGMGSEGPCKIIGSTEIDDWRYRNVPDAKIVTTLCAVSHSWGAPKAGDDAVQAEFVVLDEKLTVVPEHVCLLHMFQGWYYPDALSKGKE